jgi:hypothetical protein
MSHDSEEVKKAGANLTPLPKDEKENAANSKKIQEGMEGQRVWAKVDVGVLNQLIKSIQNIDKGQLSDGYHTFSELYDHRNALFIALAQEVSIPFGKVWRSESQSDGAKQDGWFLLGIGKEAGKQITYHLPMSEWDKCDFAETLQKAPEYDFHTSNDVLERLAGKL